MTEVSCLAIRVYGFPDEGVTQKEKDLAQDVLRSCDWAVSAFSGA